MHESTCLDSGLAECRRHQAVRVSDNPGGTQLRADISACPWQTIITILSEELQDLCTHESRKSMSWKWCGLIWHLWLLLEAHQHQPAGWFHFIKFASVSNYTANADGGWHKFPFLLWPKVHWATFQFCCSTLFQITAALYMLLLQRVRNLWLSSYEDTNPMVGGPTLMTHLNLVCVHAPLCPTLCYPKDCSLPGSFVLGIIQARTLDWVAMSFLRGSSQPRDWTSIFMHWQVGPSPLCHLGRCITPKPYIQKPLSPEPCILISPHWD